MFDMKKIGKKISALRKEANMTQMELADRMGISFQAVSNWERGNSMPDISKLPELAEIFGVTVDELLGENSTLLEAAINDNIEACMINQSASAEDVSAVLPLLKPDQVSTIVANADKLNWEVIRGMLPYMDEDDVKEFALQAQGQGEAIGMFLPFMDGDDVKEFALQARGKGESIGAFLPFLYEDDVKEFSLHASEWGENICTFLPFLCEDDVKELALQALEKGERVECFLPYMVEDDVKELTIKLLKK